MNIQTASARDDHFHSHLLGWERSRRCWSRNDTAVRPSPLGVRHKMVPLAARINLSYGVETTKGDRDLSVTASDKSQMPRFACIGYSPAGHDSIFFITCGAHHE